MEDSRSEPTTQFEDKNVSMDDTSVCQKKVRKTNWKVLLEKGKSCIGKSLQPNEGGAGPSTAEQEQEQGLKLWRLLLALSSQPEEEQPVCSVAAGDWLKLLVNVSTPAWVWTSAGVGPQGQILPCRIPTGEKKAPDFNSLPSLQTQGRVMALVQDYLYMTVSIKAKWELFPFLIPELFSSGKQN